MTSCGQTSPLMMSTLSAVLQKHRRKLHPVWNQHSVRKKLKVNVLLVLWFYWDSAADTLKLFFFFQEDFVCSRRQSRDGRLRILQLLRGVDLLPAQGSSSSVVLMNTDPLVLSHVTFCLSVTVTVTARWR